MADVLIIEDDEDIALSLKFNLETEGGFRARTAVDAESGLELALADPPDLVLLDLNLPGMDGLELCRRLREQPATADTSIIMITARVEEADRVRGLEIGADDYVIKPFSIREVMARIRAVLRRVSRPGAADRHDVLEAGPLRVDMDTRRVRIDDREVALTRREFDLLTHLLTNRGRVRTRERLLEQVWGYTHTGETRTVDVHIRQLRKKLGPPFDGYIETVVGVGYRFREVG